MNYFFWILFVLMISQVCAICESGQIDINSASLTKLDELSGIGEILAGRIIEMRPFDSVEDLIEVERIGKITLEKIIAQDLACVDDEKNEQEELEQVDFVKEVPSDLEKTEPLIPQIVETKKEDKPEIITLNSPTKDIKSKDDKKNLDKKDWAKYGFVGFCVLLGFLFILKKRKVRNEFD